MAKQRTTGGKTEATPADAPHRWAIDRVEEGTAAVEQDGDHVYEIPRYLLPANARDGDVLSVTIADATPGEVMISVRIARAASATPPSPKPARAKRRPGNDPGGDIVL